MLLISPATAKNARPSCSTKGARSASKVMVLRRTAMGPPFEGGATCGCARSVSSRRRGNQQRHGRRTPPRSARPMQAARDPAAVSLADLAGRSACGTVRWLRGVLLIELVEQQGPCQRRGWEGGLVGGALDCVVFGLPQPPGQHAG